MDTTIHKTITTKATAEEMKLYINQHILTRKGLSSLLKSSIWVGNTLNVQSKLGSGTVILQDYQAEISIELTLFGKFAKKQIESGFTTGFKQLTDKS